MAKPLALALLQRKASLVGAFFMAAICAMPAQAFCPLPVKPQQVAVRQVLDGDTVRLSDGRSVRLIGINAPELGRKGRPSEPYAEAARQRLQALIKASDGRVGLVRGAEAKTNMAALWRMSMGVMATILRRCCSVRALACAWP